VDFLYPETSVSKICTRRHIPEGGILHSHRRENLKSHIGKYLFDKFPIQNGLKQGDVLSPLICSFAFVYAIRKARENQMGLKFNGTYQLLVYADV
jgi:hypothetical protein